MFKMERTSKPVLFLSVFLPLFSFLCFAPVNQRAHASDTARGSTKEDWKAKRDQAIEKFEKEKLVKLKRQIGRKFMAVGVDGPLVFYESADDLEKKIWVKGKEPIRVVDIVLNHPGTMYFYKVKFESGKMGYLSADGLALEVLIRENRLIPLSRPQPSKQPKPQKAKSLHTVSMASEAVKMVKNHLTGKDPVTGERKTVEKRMVDAKAGFSPTLKWRYEAKGIGDDRYRVIQFVEGGREPRMTRTWIVDLYSVKVTPENAAAKKLY